MLKEEDEVSQQERVDKWGITVNKETSQAYWIFIPKKKASHIRVEDAVSNIHSNREVLPPPGIVLNNRYFVNSFESTSDTLQKMLNELNSMGLEPKFD